MAEQYSIVHMYYIFVIHSTIAGDLGRFQLWLLKTVLQWTLGCISFQTLFFPRYMPRNETAGSYGSSLFSFFFLKEPPYWSPQWLCQFAFLPRVLKDFLLFTPSPAFRILLMIAILTAMSWYLTVVLVCISLIKSNIEHLSKCFLASCMTSLEKCLFRSS